jgi:hypothetical protein
MSHNNAKSKTAKTKLKTQKPTPEIKKPASWAGTGTAGNSEPHRTKLPVASIDDGNYNDNRKKAGCWRAPGIHRAGN